MCGGQLLKGVALRKNGSYCKGGGVTGGLHSGVEVESYRNGVWKGVLKYLGG